MSDAFEELSHVCPVFVDTNRDNKRFCQDHVTGMYHYEDGLILDRYGETISYDHFRTE